MPEEKEVEKQAVEPSAKPASKGSLGKILLIAGIALGSSMSGAAAFWFLTKGTLAEASKAESAAEKPSSEDEHGSGSEEHAADSGGSGELVAEALERGAVLSLETFVANLADKDAGRYLRIKISLMIDDKAHLSELQENQALQIKLRDIILQILSGKTAQDLYDEEGKNKLRQEIHGKVKGFFKKVNLVEVMFSEFVIQL